MKKVIVSTIAMIIALVVFNGCQKDTTLVIKPVPKVITTAVSFSKDLAPLFAKDCATAGCHGDGGQSPNLTASKVYTSITSMAGFVDTKDPSNSKLYGYMTGKLSPAMPMGKASNPDDINDIFLAWVKQGAKKN